jgi:phosphohistidine phosphatase
MRLCLVRHAIAVERGLPGFVDDFSRPLTEKGSARMQDGAFGLREILVPDVILTSPLLRSRQTAQIIADAYGAVEVRICNLLATPDYEALIAEIGEIDAEAVMAVGHEPYTSELLSLLLTGEPYRLRVQVKKGAAALVRFEGRPVAGEGYLEWLIQPAGLRAIGTPARTG